MDENLIGNILGSLINKDGDNGFGGNGAWWIIILLLFFGGFGGYGFGRGADVAANALTQKELTDGFNFNGLQNDIRAVERGMCSSGYENARLIDAQTVQMINGFNNIGAGIAGVNSTVQMVGCNTNHNIDNLRNEMSQNTCAITTNATANAQRILDKLCMMESNAKDNEIATLRSELQAAQLTLGNAAQTQNIVSALRTPAPVPAYVVANPCGCYNSGTVIQ